MAKSDDKRIMPRYHTRLTVRFGIEQGKLDRAAFCVNVGPHGLFVVTSKLEPRGTRLWLEVDLPTGTISLYGQIAWTRHVPVNLRSQTKPGFGVHLDMAPEPWFAYVTLLSKRQAN